jgi:RWD domain
MGVEEQTEEREVLASIFPEEIIGSFCLFSCTVVDLWALTIYAIDISDTEFQVSVALDVSPEDNGGEEDARKSINSNNSIHAFLTFKATLLLHVTYTANYPDEAPDLNLLAPAHAPKHPYLDVSKDRDQLLASLRPTIEENLGMAMIFTLVMALKESAEQLVTERAQVGRDAHAAEIAKAEEEDNRKFRGTAVTRETFLIWREKYKKEMEEAERIKAEESAADEKKKRGAGARDELKLTGRQLWEGGLAGKGEEDEEEGMDALEGVEKLKIQA